MFRPQPISSTDARKYFTKLINKVSFSSKSFVIHSYRQPLVRIVNEHYIKALEEVVGKKTVNQVMQIAGNDQLFEAEKIEEIKKVFQRRLSGSPHQSSEGAKAGAPHPESRPDLSTSSRSPRAMSRGERPRVSEANRGGVEGRPKQGPRPAAPKHQTQPKPHNQTVKKNNPTPNTQPPPDSLRDSKRAGQISKDRGVLLLSNGRNYE